MKNATNTINTYSNIGFQLSYHFISENPKKNMWRIFIINGIENIRLLPCFVQLIVMRTSTTDSSPMTTIAISYLHFG